MACPPSAEPTCRRCRMPIRMRRHDLTLYELDWRTKHVCPSTTRQPRGEDRSNAYRT